MPFDVVLTKSRSDKNGTTSNQTTTDCLSALADNSSILTSFESSKVSKFIVLNNERIRYDTRMIKIHADLKKHMMGATSGRKFENR